MTPADVAWAGIVGGVVATATVFDVWALRTGRETLTGTTHRYRRAGVPGVVLAGGWVGLLGGLTYHLFIESPTGASGH